MNWRGNTMSKEQNGRGKNEMIWKGYIHSFCNAEEEEL